MARRKRFEKVQVDKKEPTMQEHQDQTEDNEYTYVNQKGGATKTTECQLNSIAGAKSGKNVLATDLDHSQGTLTYALGYDPSKLTHTVYTAMIGESLLEEAILHTYYDPKTGIFFDPNDTKKMQRLRLSSLDDAARGPDLLPMNPKQVVNVERDLINRGDWGGLLQRIYHELKGRYVEFHTDTNPDIQGSIFPRIATYAASHIVIPNTPDNWSVQGMIQLAEFLLRARLDSIAHFAIAGVVFGRVRYEAHQQMIDMTEQHVVPDVNQLFRQQYDQLLRRKRYQDAEHVKSLRVEVFTNRMSESKEHSVQTSIRSTVMTSKKAKRSEFTPELEQWLCYIELLKRTKGAGIEQAVACYNRLFENYEQVVK